ncbi:MAG: AI-2E family transporter [Candidatus Krumholzibacteria bacterium]|nr:AI-2E family transporter [Candidatus Krumholzibacteria bacterium]
MNTSLASKSVLLMLLAIITVVFFSMIKAFLMAVLLAGIFSSLTQPLYKRLLSRFGGRAPAASIVTLLLIVLVIILPLGLLLGIVTGEAIKVGNAVTPWVQDKLTNPDQIMVWLQNQPFYDRVAPYQDNILTKAGEMVGLFSKFLINSLSAATTGTVQFLFMLMIMLYSMYFFLIDGYKLVDLMLYYLPLEDHEERRLLEKFSSVTRATLKGTAAIGTLQGSLAGIAFAAVGVPSAVFWGAIMVVLSIIPGIGTALVWLPAAVILIAGGHLAKGIFLAVFCGLVVGSVDNFLRPRMVGKDTELPDLLILLATMGGILMFGALGLIIGPIVAALFVTIWEIYGDVFQDVLPPGRQPELPTPVAEDQDSE